MFDLYCTTISPDEVAMLHAIEKNKSAISPAAFVAPRMKRKRFTHTADVHINGDMIIGERLVVGGNLVVDGNLTADEIYCVGKITVQGNISFMNAYVGIAIHAEGNISGTGLEIGCDAERIATLMGLEESFENEESILNRLVHPDIASELEYVRQNRSEPAVVSGGLFDLSVLEVIGNIEVRGCFDVDSATINSGCLSAQRIVVGDDLYVGGCVDSASDISVSGNLQALDIHCIGNMYAASIECEGSIDVEGFIEACGNIVAVEDIQTQRSIFTSGKIQTGKFIKAGECVIADEGVIAGNDYGVLAGLNLPRSQWSESGYISAPAKPRNIFTGCFVSGKTAENFLKKS